MRPFAPILAAGALALALAAPAAAQTDQQQTDNQRAAPSSPCQAQPDQNKNSGNGNSQSDTGQPSGQPSGGDLTQKLDNCNGVLKPPPTGDAELTEPAPDQGKTPVIKPGEVPPQPPQ